MYTPADKPVYRRNWAVIVLAAVIFVVGSIIGSGGGYLVSLGGSPYYLTAGILMIASGAMLACQRSEGAIIYYIRAPVASLSDQQVDSWDRGCFHTGGRDRRWLWHRRASAGAICRDRTVATAGERHG